MTGRGARRRIGGVGTTTRGLLGVGLVVATWMVGPVGWLDLVLGLVVLPAVTTLLLRLRGADAPPLRSTGPFGHVANVAIGVVLAVLMLQPTMLFYAAAMIVAAFYGYAGCELFAFANRLNGRDDEIGCVVFSPIDAVERRRTGSHS